MTELTLKDLQEAKRLLMECEPDPSVNVPHSFRCGSQRVMDELMEMAGPANPKDPLLAIEGALVKIDERVPVDEIHALNVYGNIIGICVLKERGP